MAFSSYEMKKDMWSHTFYENEINPDCHDIWIIHCNSLCCESKYSFNNFSFLNLNNKSKLLKLKDKFLLLDLNKNYFYDLSLNLNSPPNNSFLIKSNLKDSYINLIWLVKSIT